MDIVRKMRKIRDNEIEVQFSAWDSRYPEVWRVCLNDEKIVIAEPGLGGDFRLSYKWRWQFPAQGWGIVSIKRYLKEKYNAGINRIEDPVLAERLEDEYYEAVAAMLLKARDMMRRA